MVGKKSLNHSPLSTPFPWLNFTVSLMTLSLPSTPSSAEGGGTNRGLWTVHNRSSPILPLFMLFPVSSVVSPWVTFLSAVTCTDNFQLQPTQCRALLSLATKVGVPWGKCIEERRENTTEGGEENKKKEQRVHQREGRRRGGGAPG